jgi:predicted metal-dependent peptidase
VIYGSKFIAKLNDKELAFLVLHEAMHRVYRHLTTWRKLYNEDAQLANMACDYVINIELFDLDPDGKHIVMPKEGLLDPQYRGMNSKQVFDLLKKQGKRKGDNPDGPDGFDEHDWQGADDMSDEEKKELGREIDRAIRQGVMAAKKVGKGAGGMSRELEDLLTPKVDWREELREFIKSTCANKDMSTWRRPNRRYVHQGVYMPSMIGVTVGPMMIGIDTSGSIGVRELSDFLSEVKCIAEDVMPEQVDLLYWDSEVAKHEVYSRADLPSLVATTQPAGGGGTSPCCVTSYMEEKNMKPEVAVMLTDGYVGNDWGGVWPCPVLWVVVGNNNADATTGRTIHVEAN